MHQAAYWIVALVVFSALVFPGALLARQLWRGWTPAMHMALGPIVGLPLLLVCWRLFGAGPPLIWSTILGAIAVLGPVAWFTTGGRKNGSPALILAALFVHFVAAIAVQTLWDAPSFHGGDFFGHTFRAPYGFLVDGSLRGDRPVLVTLTSLAVLDAFRGDLTTQWVFQLVFSGANTLVVGPGILLAERWGGRRAAWCAAGLLALNPFMVQQTFYCWPKMAAAAGVLAIVYLLFARDDRSSAFAAGLAAAVAYCCHQQAALFVLPTGLIWFLRRDVADRWIRALLVLAAGAGGFAIFVVWAGRFSYDPSGSQQLLCPLMNEWWYIWWNRPVEEVIARFHEFTPWELFRHRALNWVATFAPNRSFSSNPVDDRHFYFEYDKATAAVGFVAFTLACVTGWRLARHRQAGIASRAILLSAFAWTVSVAAFAGCVVHGLAGWGLPSFVALLLVLAAVGVAAAPPPRRALLLSAIVVETLFWCWRWVVHMRVIVAGHQELGDPRFDDFLERDLRTVGIYAPGDLFFADDFVGSGGAWVVVAIGLLLCAAAVFGAVRSAQRDSVSTDSATTSTADSTG